MENLKYEIIVSRYNENIDWVKKYNNCKVYNKGKNFDGNYIKLDNKGRESHTYLHHIVKNYHNLADYTIFTQGNPFDHSPNFFDTVNGLISNGFEKNFGWISEKIIEGDFEYKREPYTWPGFPSLRFAYEFVFGDEPKEETFLFGAGAQFYVSKENILARPIGFYQKIYDLLEEDEIDNTYMRLLYHPDSQSVNRVHPEMAFYLERFWGIIFDEV
jgi:hypothetical protein